MSLFDKLNQHKNDRLSKEKEEGEAFLAENEKKEGVIALADGLQYQVLQEGAGDKPMVHSNIKAHYAGRLLNGKEFDSSYRRNQPFTAPVNALIKGWQIVLPMMPAGSKWRIWVPSDLGYGDRGTGGIPGGAVLEFDIELLEILS